MESSRNRAALGGAALLLLVFAALAATCAYHMGYLPMRRFDAQVWRDGNRSETARVEMIDSLIQSGRLDGLSRAEVLALLGAPNGGDYFADWDLVYRLGQERGLIRIDSEWLTIRFGPDGRVAEYGIMRD